MKEFARVVSTQGTPRHIRPRCRNAAVVACLTALVVTSFPRIVNADRVAGEPTLQKARNGIQASMVVPPNPPVDKRISATNSVIVESKIVAPNTQGVNVGIYIENVDNLTGLVLSLQFRRMSGGAYMAHASGLTVQGRVAGSGLMEDAHQNYYSDPNATNSCSGPFSQTWTVPSQTPSGFGGSPDALLWAGYTILEPELTPGSDGIPGDGTPSFIFTFDANDQPGTFEIDTCCVTPANHLIFNTDAGQSLVPSFTKGVIQIGTAAHYEVAVESKTVNPGDKNVTLEISLGNKKALDAISIPLIARTSGTAFWTNVDTLPWHGRLGNALTSARVFDKSGADGISPDNVLLQAAANADPCLASGNLEGTITLRFDVNSGLGSFEIDTAFITPDKVLSFDQCLSANTIAPDFTAGIVSIYFPAAGGGGPPKDWFTFTPLPLTGGAVYGVTADDYDGDKNLDVALAASCCPSDSVRVFFGDGAGYFYESPPLTKPLAAITSAFVNADALPDLIGVEDQTGTIYTYLSNGDRTFDTAYVTPGAATSGPLSIAAGYIDSDAYIDLIVKDRLYFGTGTGTFTFADSVFGIKVNSVGLVDVNDDGFLDAVTAGSAASIFLGDGNGNFTFQDSVHVGDAWSIQVLSNTGNTVDFNEDNRADFVLTYPRTSGNSDVYIFFGDGEGNIGSFVSLAVDGTCYPAAVLDFDYDEHLDIAVGSATYQFVKIFRGEGTGQFTPYVTAFTYLAPPPNSVEPLSMVVGDFREDGIWDFAIGGADDESGVFLGIDTPVPVSLLDDSSMVSVGYNSVQFRVTNPSNLSAELLGIHIPGARCEFRDADSNAAIDQQISDLNLQEGTYKFDVWVKPGEDPDAHYTLAIGIDGHQFRYLARNASAPAVGDTFHFQFPIGDGLEVNPPTGSLASGSTPTFDWSQVTSAVKSAVSYEFELDDYWDFATPLISESDLASPQYTVQNPLPLDSLFYWRYRSFDGSTWSDYSVAYAVIIPPACACPHQSDFDDDGLLTALDLGQMIDILYAGQTDLRDPTCSSPRADFDCDGFSTTLDLSGLIDHLFASGEGPCDPCAVTK